MAGKGYTRLRPVVVVVGVFVCSLALHGAPKDGAVRSGRAAVDRYKGWSVTEVPHAAPSYGYRSETVLRREFGGENPLIYVAGAKDDPWGTVASPMTGGPSGECAFDYDCDDCNPCTDDTCEAEACVSEFLRECDRCEDGVYCNGRERCDASGTCLDADTFKAPDWDPCYAQTTMICDEEAGASHQGKCVLPCRGDTECDSGTRCDGTEACVFDNSEPGSGGYCLGGAIAGTACTGQGQCGNVCSDGIHACDPDADCPGGYCAVMDGVCVGGSNPGAACDVSSDCPVAGTTCGYCAGVCRQATPSPCGANTYCTETECGWGRCCQPDDANPGEYLCSRLTLPACDSTGGRWLAVGDDPNTPYDDGFCEISWWPSPDGDLLCPKYESGMTSGTILGDLGIAGVALCNDYLEIGDDYKLSNFASEDWLGVTTIRFIGGWVDGTNSRMRITFYDSAGTFIGDRITNLTDSGTYMHTVIVDWGLIIPAEGFITIQASAQFGLESKQVWSVVSETAANVGVNDPNYLYVNRCTAGVCSGLQKTHISSLIMADGSPVTNGVLAFEIVGWKAYAPVGACCRPDTGVCSAMLRWDCEDSGGLFQGEGRPCNVCINDPYGWGCDTDADCQLCEGGSNPGRSCPDGDEDCYGGGTCHIPEAGDCLPSPLACQTSACCNIVTGTCTTVGGLAGAGLCSAGGTGGGGDGCFNNEECVASNGAGSECVAQCGANSYSRGFGTDCDPDCCVQQLSGADTCLEAPILAIPVPAPGEPPIQFTLTGNNKQATFGDFSGETCTYWMFDESDRIRDRGWWHAFEIMSCANIRIDFCCTQEISGEVHQPQWAFLFTECNDCGGQVYNSIIGEPPYAPGDLSEDYSYGDPYCTESDDIWMTFGPLPAGTYYLPIYSAPGGHFGEYQLHITAQACQERACCLDTATCIGNGIVSHGNACTENGSCPRCVGGSNDGDPCTAIGEVDVECPEGGVCTGTCVGGLNDGYACIDTTDCPNDLGPSYSCDGPFCPCKGNCVADCDDLNELDCSTAGGYWYGFRNLPTGENESLCFTGVCDSGSCCTAPGVCQDWSETPGPGCEPETGERCCSEYYQGSCMDKKLCDMLEGEFVGGGRCDFPATPCPVCEIQGENNCQLQSLPGTVLEFHMLSDLTIPPHGVTVADDFIPSQGDINEICIFGSYVDPTRNIAVPQYGCAGMVTDQFRVRVYTDNAGLPGNLVAERWVCESDGGSKCVANGGNDGVILKNPEAASYLTIVYDLPTFVYTLSLTNPITGLRPGDRYFLEIANDTSQIPGDLTMRNFCRWQWAQINQGDRGNDQMVVGTDDRPIYLNPIGTTSEYWGQAFRWTDMAFCIDQDFEAPQAEDHPEFADLVGACCTCPDVENNIPGECYDGETLLECHFGGLGQATSEGVWNGGLACGGTDPISGQAVCAVQDGDSCDGSAGSVAVGLDCAPPVIGIPGKRKGCFSGCAVNYDTVCATTDGPDDASLGQDLWMAFTSDCSGSVIASLCANGNYIGSYDSAVEVYHDYADPTNCPCPGANTPPVQGGLLGDEGCNGLMDAGPGIVGDISRIPTIPGECWLIRIAGWIDGDGGGKGMLDVACIPLRCSESSAPEYAPLVVDETDPALNEDMVTTRLLTFRAGDPGERQAIRVTVASMPVGYEYAEGRTMWVGPPRELSENAGKTDPADAPGFPTFYTAELQCEPYYRDWHGYCAAGSCIGGVAEGSECTTQDDCYKPIVVSGRILNPNAVPGDILMSDGATYEIQVVRDDCMDLSDEESYSAPLTIVNGKWGDIVGHCGGDRCTLGEGVINITSDVTAMMNKFKNLPGAPIKARIDIEPEGFDLRLAISDVTLVLNAFSGFGYAFDGPSTTDPCASFAR